MAIDDDSRRCRLPSVRDEQLAMDLKRDSTSLVRDGKDEGNDPPPADREPGRRFVPVDTTFGSSDPHRAGAGGSSNVDYGMVANGRKCDLRQRGY